MIDESHEDRRRTRNEFLFHREHRRGAEDHFQLESIIMWLQVECRLNWLFLSKQKKNSFLSGRRERQRPHCLDHVIIIFLFLIVFISDMSNDSRRHEYVSPSKIEFWSKTGSIVTEIPRRVHGCRFCSLLCFHGQETSSTSALAWHSNLLLIRQSSDQAILFDGLLGVYRMTSSELVDRTRALPSMTLVKRCLYLFSPSNPLVVCSVSAKRCVCKMIDLVDYFNEWNGFFFIFMIEQRSGHTNISYAGRTRRWACPVVVIYWWERERDRSVAEVTREARKTRAFFWFITFNRTNFFRHVARLVLQLFLIALRHNERSYSS